MFGRPLMRSPFFRPVCLLFCSSLLLINPMPAASQEQNEPQLARINYAQGEVKFSPGRNGKPDLNSEWMQAESGLSLDEGYSLATEDGRATVEFENGSVAYLSERSVLQFTTLRIKA